MQFGTRTTHRYDRCTDCGSLQRSDVSSDGANDYPPDYYAHQLDTTLASPLRATAILRRAWTRARLACPGLLRPFSGRRFGRFDWFARTEIRIDAPILDVGCGSGRLLRRLHRAGFSNLTGIDPALPAGCADGPSPRLLRAKLEHFEFRAELLMAHHSFEHASDPRRAFADYRRLTAPGAFLLLRVPRADSWAARHYGRDWVQLDSPRHRFIPTLAAIERLARDHGFELERVVDDSGPFQIWGSELYRRDIPLVEASRRMSPLSLRWLRVRSRLRAHGLRRRGAGDQACFYLRRVEALAGDARSGAAPIT